MSPLIPVASAPSASLSRRAALRWLLLGGAAAALGACRRAGESRAAQAEVTLTLWVLEESFAPPDIYQLIADEFMAQHPEVRLVIERRANDAYKEALRLAINTPAAPDGFFSWSGLGLGGFYVNAGGARPLTDYYRQYDWEKRFTRAALAGTYFNNVQYGIPFRGRGMGIYYRKDAFARAGIAGKPATYEALIDACRKLRAIGCTPLGMGGKFGWMLMRLTDSLLETTCGAASHDALRALGADWSATPGVTAAYRELRRWVEEGFLPADFLGVDPGDVRMSVYQGKAAMLYEGDWMIEFLRSDGMSADDYDFFAFPTGTGRLSFFSEMFFISSISRQPDEMARFYDFWTSPATQARHAGRFGAIPPTVGVAAATDTPAHTRAWQDAAANCTGTYVPADQALPLEVFGNYLRVQAGVVSGTVAPEAAGAAMQTAIVAFKRNGSAKTGGTS
jgi:raffinose/stachyose/melibiose transport system substrate-binding protein